MQKSFEVQGPVELDVRLASGDIEVDPTTDGRVEVDLIAHDEESQRLIDDARIELVAAGHRPTIVVDVPQKKGFSFTLFGRSGVECRIRCPHDSGLAIRTKSADVEARGTLGGLNVSTASGDIEVERVSGGVNIKSASSDFTAREVGPTNVQTASGDIDITIARGPLNITSVSGDISISEAYDNINANSVSGDQDHGAVMTGIVAAHSVSGDITIGVRRGSRAFLECTTVSGDTSSDLEMTGDAPPASDNAPFVEIRAKTVSGDIRITRAPAPTGTQEVHA